MITTPAIEEPKPQEPAPGILIIGSGGTGKTTLARLLAGQHHKSPLELPGEYVESMEIERYRVENPLAEIVVPPGQHRHRTRDWGQLYTALSKGEYRGVIIVTSYGHHSLGVSYKEHPTYKNMRPKSVQGFVKKYCEDQRKDELNVLRVLAPHMKQCPGKFWLLTVVTKEDLWCKYAHDVEQWYREGEYGEIVTDIMNHRGNPHFRADVVLTSLLISNYTTTPLNEILSKNVAGYDQIRQVKSLRRLFASLSAFRKWEAE